MSIEAIKLAAEFNRYFTSANGVDVPAKVSVSRDEWRALFTAIHQAEAQQPATGESVVEPMALYNKVESKIVQRYVVEKRTGGGFWPYCVRACGGEREIFVGHKVACENVRAALQTACLDGAFMADIAARSHPAPSVPDDVMRDAERYRFIRDADVSDDLIPDIALYAMESLDEYIDAAMLAAKTGGRG